MILVTGAAGKTGRAVTHALAARGLPVRALIRREEQRHQALAAGARETFVGEMGDRKILTRAMQGIRAVYHICPNVSPREIDFGRVAIAAALEVGVSRFAYHSVLHPQTEQMPHHWLKMRVEELILQSRLQFTILQPAAYMQNVLAGMEDIVNRGIYQIPYPPDTALSMVDLGDVAEVAATVLAQPGHASAIYELVGPDVFSQNEVVAMISQALNRPVQLVYLPIDRWKRQALENGLGKYETETLAMMFEYYGSYGFRGNSNALEWLLGREPTSFPQFVDKHFQPAAQ